MSFKINKKEMKTAIDSIEDNGFYVFKSFFKEDDLSFIESAIANLYLLQAKKIGDYKTQIDKLINSNPSNFKKFSDVCSNLEEKDKEALYQIQKFIEISPNIRSIFDKNFLNICAEIMNSNTQNILLNGPALFINKPNTKRLLYKWHSELSYYPKRRNFLNIWFPIFSDRNLKNGTMKFKAKSHKDYFPFSEYQGYEIDSSDKKKSFIQYEIPENFLSNYEDFSCNISRTDLIIFDKNLVHTSTENFSKDFSATVVAKVWDPSDDLTISGDIAAKPYKNDMGRSNLIVDI